jgi:GNAT superfamily N-acetyltransferase
LTANLRIGWHTGEREELRALFALAEDSPLQLDEHLPQGRVLVATDHGKPVGHLQLVDCATAGEVELLTLAVAEDRQGDGVGRELVERAIAECRATGAGTLLVATAAADTGVLRFYQRLGFRMLRIERDAFTPSEGYPEGIAVDGIPVRDRVWLSLALWSR